MIVSKILSTILFTTTNLWTKSQSRIAININDWDKLPDETVEKILIQDIERFGHACETYKNIINSCSRFQIIKK